MMSVYNLDEAEKALAEREGIKEKYIGKFVGVWWGHFSSADETNLGFPVTP